MIKCEYCGNMAKDTEDYCPTCGAKLQHIQKPEEKKPEVPPQINININAGTFNAGPTQKPPAQKSSAQATVVIGICLVATILIFVVTGISNFKKAGTSASNPVGISKPTVSEADMILRFNADNTDEEALKYLVDKTLHAKDRQCAISYFDLFSETSPANTEIFITIARIFNEYGYPDSSAYVLLKGFDITADTQLKAMLSEYRLEDVVNDGGMRQAIELIFKKPIAEVTYDDVSKIRYLSLSSSHITYSFEAPEIADGSIVNSDLYNEGVNSFNVDSKFSSLSDLSLFANMEVLELRNISLDVKELTSLKNIKILDLECSLRNEDLRAFASFIHLEGLTVSGSSIKSLSGVSDIAGLKRLWVKSTGIADLSLLSTLNNIVSLSLERNNELKSIQTLNAYGLFKRNKNCGC